VSDGGPAGAGQVTGGCGNTLAEDRREHSPGAQQRAGSADRESDGVAVPAARVPPAADPEYPAAAAADLSDDEDGDWRNDGIGGLFGSRAGQQAGAAFAPEFDTAGGSLSLADTEPDVVPAEAAARPRRRRRRTSAATPQSQSQPQQPAAMAARGTHARNGYGWDGYGREGPPAAQATAQLPDARAAALLIPPRRRAPAPGWRRTVYRASAGFVRVPASPAEDRRRDMISRARTPVAAGHHRVAVLSLKGGAGKTTVTMGLGSTLAAIRGDRVIAVDANPDRGTLADRLPAQTLATVGDLLAERDSIRRYADVRGYTAQAGSRLEVLASARDPAATAPFGEQDYRRVCAVLERFYSVCITDCGTGLLHSAMAGVLGLADQIVLVTTGSVDGARSASACLDWLAAHGHHDLVRNGVVVVTAVRRHSRTSVDLDLLEGHFAARCRAVAVVPYDPYLAQGAEVELDQLRRSTAGAFLELAAVVGDGFNVRRTERRALAAPDPGDSPG
jgi:MinD-like ATPase involved in chromosome partitioning or flagellar assembly